MKRWSDIERDLYFGGYVVSCGFEHIDKLLKDFAPDGMEIEFEPDFQRHHVWNDAQRTAYIEYLMRGGLSARTIYFNHTTWETLDSSGSFQLVDGLQRYTAIKKFMNNELKVFGTYLDERKGGVDVVMARIEIGINNLKTRAEVLDWYLRINDGGVVHTQDELSRVRELLEAELAGEKSNG